MPRKHKLPILLQNITLTCLVQITNTRKRGGEKGKRQKMYFWIFGSRYIQKLQLHMRKCIFIIRRKNFSRRCFIWCELSSKHSLILYICMSWQRGSSSYLLHHLAFSISNQGFIIMSLPLPLDVPPIPDELLFLTDASSSFLEYI